MTYQGDKVSLHCLIKLYPYSAQVANSSSRWAVIFFLIFDFTKRRPRAEGAGMFLRTDATGIEVRQRVLNIDIFAGTLFRVLFPSARKRL